MNPVAFIVRKREGASLTPAEVEEFFAGYLAGDVEDYQMAAFLMAVLWRGLDAEELDALVDVMVRSGEVLDLSGLDGPRVDKHSAGGVGDKVSIALAPLAAELGLFVPMMSGRGLGHTGGTLDKLEAIPGFRTALGLAEFEAILRRVGCAMIGQTEEIAPLDRRLYDLRSVTGTVPSLPLIASSIMSKKLAEGLSALVLDVKVGDGANLPDEAEAVALARTMTAIGETRGLHTTALLTAMDRPLGRAIGNGLETAEALRCLAGGGPPDLRELVVELATEMCLAGGLVTDPEAGRSRARAALDDGSALVRMERLIEAQGGDPAVAAEPGTLAKAPEVEVVRAGGAGVVRRVSPRPLGHGVVALGGGRRRLGEDIDPTVGFVLLVEPGTAVAVGDPLAEVHARDAAGLELGRRVVLDAIPIGEEAAPLRPLISHRIEARPR